MLTTSSTTGGSSSISSSVGIEVIPNISLRHHVSLGIRWIDFGAPPSAPPWCPPALRSVLLDALRDVASRTVVPMRELDNLPVSEYLTPATQNVSFWMDETPSQPQSLSTWAPVHHFKRPAVLVTGVHVLRLNSATARNDLRERMIAVVRKLSPLVHFTLLFGADTNSPPAWASGEYFIVPSLPSVPTAMSSFIRGCARECVTNVLARLRGMLVTHPEAIESDPNYTLPWESAEKGARSAQQLSLRALKRKSDYLLQIGSLHCAFTELSSDAALGSGPIEETWAVGILESLAAGLHAEASRFFNALQRLRATVLTAAQGNANVSAGNGCGGDGSPLVAGMMPEALALIESVAALEHRRGMSYATKLLERSVSSATYLKPLVEAANTAIAALKACLDVLRQEKDFRASPAAANASLPPVLTPSSLDACRALEKALVEEIDKMLFTAQILYSQGIKRNETLRELDLEVRLKRLVLWSEHRSGVPGFVLTTNLGGVTSVVAAPSLTSSSGGPSSMSAAAGSSSSGSGGAVLLASSGWLSSTVALTTFVRQLDDVQTLAGRLPHEVRTAVLLQAARICEASGLHRRAILMQFIAAFACLENQDHRALAEVDKLLHLCGAPFRIEPSSASLVPADKMALLRQSESSLPLTAYHHHHAQQQRQSRRIQTLAVHLAYQLAKAGANASSSSSSSSSGAVSSNAAAGGWQSLKCQLAGALVTNYAGFLRPEHIYPILDTIALSSGNLPPGIQPWYQPLPIVVGARPLPLPSARRPVLVDVSRFFMTGAPNTWVLHHGRLFSGDMPVFVAGEVFSIAVTFSNPFPYALQFDSVRLGLLAKRKKQQQQQPSQGQPGPTMPPALLPNAAEGQSTEPAPFFQRVSVCDVTLNPKEIQEVVLHGVCDSTSSSSDNHSTFLMVDAVELFVTSKPRTGTLSLATTEPMVVPLPSPLTVPVVPPLPVLDGLIQPVLRPPNHHHRLWCGQSSEIVSLAFSNVGAQTIPLCQVSVHFAQCRTASCTGCSGKRSAEEQNFVICNRTDQGDVRDLRQGEVATVCFQLSPPTSLKQASVTHLVARVLYGTSLSAAAKQQPPAADWLREKGVGDHDTVRSPQLMRLLEVPFSVLCEPGPSVTGFSLSFDRRFLEIAVHNGNPTHPIIVRTALSYHTTGPLAANPTTAGAAGVATWSEGVTCSPKNELSLRVPIVESLFINNTANVESVSVSSTSSAQQHLLQRSVRPVIVSWEAAMVTAPPPAHAHSPVGAAATAVSGGTVTPIPAVATTNAAQAPSPSSPIMSGAALQPMQNAKVRGVIPVDVSNIVPTGSFTEIFSHETVLCTVVIVDAGADNAREEQRWFSFLARRPIVTVTAVETLSIRVTLAAPTWTSVVPLVLTVAIEPPQAMIFGKLSSPHSLGDKGKVCVELTLDAILFFPGDYTLNIQAVDTVSGTTIAFSPKMTAVHRARSMVPRGVGPNVVVLAPQVQRVQATPSSSMGGATVPSLQTQQLLATSGGSSFGAPSTPSSTPPVAAGAPGTANSRDSPTAAIAPSKSPSASARGGGDEEDDLY